MALPANVTTLVVLGTFLTPEGNPSTGTITFTPSRWLTNSGADVAIPNSGVTKTLGTAGNFTVTLPVTDDGDLQPANWFYTVSEVVDGVSQSYALLLPGTAGSGGTVYLADLAPAGELGPEYASLRGPAGEAATLAIGTTTSVSNSGTASVTNVGTNTNGTLNFVLRDGPTGPQGIQGIQGVQGNTGTFAVGTTTSVTNSGTASVTNVGSSTAGTFDFVLRDGPTGPTGPQGPTASLAVGAVSSVTNSGTASVTNVGSSSAGTFDFVLRDGPTGPQGATGTAATITIGTIGTVAFPGPGTVTNSGTTGAAVLDFILVTGPQGAIGDLTAADPIAYVGSQFSLKYGAGLGTATGGTLVADFSDATPLALGTAAAGTAIELARGDHRHAMPSADDVGAVGKALVDAKGDLVTATADNTPAVLTVGSNGQMLVADSAATAGLRYIDPPSGNALINGNFAVNQRSFSSTTTNLAFTFDRWLTEFNAGGGTVTYSAQTFSPGAAPVAGQEGTNFARCVTASMGATNYAILLQKIEDVRTFANRTVTVSFWAKAASGTPQLGFNLTQGFGSGGSAMVTISGTPVTVSTSWARYSITFTLPSISGKTIGAGSHVGAYFVFSENNVLTSDVPTQNNTFDVWGVQLETGPVATPFEFEPFEATLRKCQRYYYRAETDSANVPFGLGQCHGTTTGVAIVPFPTTMRTQPTALEQTGTAGDYRVWTSTAGVQNLTAVPSFNSATRDLGAIGFTVASGLTAGNATGLLRTNTSAYLAWSAEL
jgi:hypothetical protein